MPEIQYPTNPNSDTAFVVQDDGTKNRALMTAPQDISTLELPKNANSCKGYVTVDGKKQRVILTADISGNGGGSSLPDQTGHSGEFLTTDGTDASWAAVESLPTQTGNAGKFLTTDGTDASWSDKPLVNNAKQIQSLAVGSLSSSSGKFAVSVGAGSQSLASGTAVGRNSFAIANSVAIGEGANTINATSNAIAVGKSTACAAQGAIQLGSTGSTTTNSDANTFKVANANGNFEIMSADGTIPEARLADTTNAAQGQVLTLDSNLNAVWQAGGGGLPSQTGQSGKFLTTDGTDASWSDKPLVNTATGTDAITIAGTPATLTRTINIGVNNNTNGRSNVCIGVNGGGTGSYITTVGDTAKASGQFGLALGHAAQANATHAIQLGTYGNGYATPNTDANTFKVANANGNFELMNANGNLPADRLAPTTGLADGNYRLRLVMASGVPTLEWVAE